MSPTLRHTMVSLRDLLASAGPLVVLAVALLGLAYWWLDPMPPRQVRLATGPAQSAYDEFGKRYAQALAQQGITVELLSTEGSAHNLQLLRSGQVDLGFVQGGSNVQPLADETSLESLGSLFLEPVWMFYREAAARSSYGRATLTTLSELQGLRVNVGSPGSGVPSLMDKLFEANRMAPERLRLSRLSQTPATVAFLNQELDVLVFASAPESPMVQMLLQTPGVRLMNFAQNEAYARRFAFLSPVVLPRGVVDLAADLPPRDVRLIASTTMLLAREEVHPALRQLFSQAALQLHGQAGWFSRAREFPSLTGNEFPLAREAERTLQQGIPLLQRYLPFTLANLMERMWLALGLILAVLLPLSRIVPPLYELRIRSRVFRWYAQLRAIDAERLSPHSDAQALHLALDELDARVSKIKLPLAYADELYALRNHIEMIRRQLRSP